MQTQSGSKQEQPQQSQSPGQDYISGSFGTTQTPEEELNGSADHTNTGNSKDIGSAPGSAGTNDSAGIEDKPEAKPTADDTMSAGDLFTGETVVELVDTAIPPLLVLGAKKVGYDIGSKKDYQLTAKEKTTLSKPVQRCLESLKLNLSNPWHALIITATAIYGSKFVDNHESIKRIKKAKVVKPSFTSAPRYDFPKDTNIEVVTDSAGTVQSVNEYEAIKQEEKVVIASLTPEEKKYKKLVDDTRKSRKESIAKSIAWLQKKGKLPSNYFYPQI